MTDKHWPHGLILAFRTWPTIAMMLAAAFTLPAASIFAQCPEGWVPGAMAMTGGGGVDCLVTTPEGQILVGGAFETAGSIPATSVALYTPGPGGGAGGIGMWTSMAPETLHHSSRARDVAIRADGTVVIGGEFRFVPGNSSYNSIAYNGSGPSGTPGIGPWSPIGIMTSSAATFTSVVALVTVPGGPFADDVIAGGPFVRVGGLGVLFIARHHVDAHGVGTWHAIEARNPDGSIGFGTNGTVLDLAANASGEVIAAGTFTQVGGAGGIVANHIASFTPGTNGEPGIWKTMGEGVNNFVNVVIALANGDLIVGGGFTMAGVAEAAHIARYSPSTGLWSSLGSGVNNHVTAIAELADGRIVAGGRFTMAGNVAANRIAIFDQSTNTWSPLGSGLNGDVKALAVVQGGDLLVGGDFSQAMNGPSRLARYTFGTPAPTIAENPQPQFGCLGGTSSFSVTAANGPFSVRWRKDGNDIDPAANSTAHLPTLTLDSIRALDAGTYDCVVTTACGAVTSTPATLTICAADINCVGGVSADDIFAFIDAWFPQNGRIGPGLSADFNGNQEVSANDVFAFLDAWFVELETCGG